VTLKEMKNLLKTAILSVIVTVLLLTLPIFYVGIEFIFLPIILALFLTGAVGIITIPIVLISHLKKRNQHKWLFLLSGVAIGFYIAYFIMIPINQWDQRKREISGQVLAGKLEDYKQKHGVFPDSLVQLNTALRCLSHIM
jgi:NADH:ubiquinone oxidoreductase subunit 6 (subunit J)